jgi:large subunit ribosomal protein L23
MDIRSVIKKPILTEKASVLKEKNNRYTFVVDKEANKFQIKQAIETLFNVNVKSVRTLNYKGKSKKVGTSSGYKSNWKKAIVKLRENQEIQTVDET